MKALDLFCGAGGSAMGLHRAGFTTIIGVDNHPQPNYPFDFILADALVPPLNLTDFDLIWASPPCQAYSIGARRWPKSRPDLVGPTREMLVASGVPYIIENVVGAPLLDPIYLEGPMFNLGVIRRRLFESNLPLVQPPRVPKRGTVRDGTYATVAGHGGDGSARLARWCEAMGIDWMTKDELREAIPPAYAEFLGRQVLRFL